MLLKFGLHVIHVGRCKGESNTQLSASRRPVLIGLVSLKPSVPPKLIVERIRPKAASDTELVPRSQRLCSITAFKKQAAESDPAKDPTVITKQPLPLATS